MRAREAPTLGIHGAGNSRDNHERSAVTSKDGPTFGRLSTMSRQGR